MRLKKSGGGIAKIGIQATGIYLIHDFVLNILVPEQMPIYQSAMGKVLVMANLTVSMALAISIITLLAQNKITRLTTLGR